MTATDRTDRTAETHLSAVARAEAERTPRERLDSVRLLGDPEAGPLRSPQGGGAMTAAAVPVCGLPLARNLDRPARRRGGGTRRSSAPASLDPSDPTDRSDPTDPCDPCDPWLIACLLPPPFQRPIGSAAVPAAIRNAAFQAANASGTLAIRPPPSRRPVGGRHARPYANVREGPRPNAPPHVRLTRSGSERAAP